MAIIWCPNCDSEIYVKKVTKMLPDHIIPFTVEKCPWSGHKQAITSSAKFEYHLADETFGYSRSLELTQNEV